VGRRERGSGARETEREQKTERGEDSGGEEETGEREDGERVRGQKGGQKGAEEEK